MADQWRVYYCANPGCHLKGIRTKVFGQLVGIRFYGWPNLTCTACGRPPQTLLAGETAIPAPEKTAVPAKRKK